MIFLNPAVLFGLLAASVPVLIHLLNLRKLKKIEFSTLAFLKELQKNKIRKIKIRQWLLLALRVMIIIFLVLAFARPALEGIAIGGTTSAAKTTAVFILDNTFSMSVVDGSGSYFNQAKQSAEKLVRNLQEGDEAALILTGEDNDAEPRLTNNLSELLKRIEDAQLSDASNKIHSAVIKASKILSESKNFNKEIYILSDFQKNNLFEPGSLSDLSALIDEQVKIYCFAYSGKEIYNLGIDDLKLNTQIFENNKPVSFNVTITNYSGRTAENIVVSLFLNEERSAQQSVTLEAGKSAVLTLEGLVKTKGIIDVTAEIEDDEILQDNRRYTSLFIPTEIPVALFYDQETDTRFIELALNAAGEENLLKVTKKNLNQLSSFDLGRFETVIITGSVPEDNSRRLKTYINNGGSAFILPGSGSQLSGFGKFTAALGIPAPKEAAGNLNEIRNPVRFEKIEYQHPLFQNIFSKEKIDVESPEVYYYFRIYSGGKGLSIIDLSDGSSFLSEYKSGKGKILLLSTSPVLSWSDFPLKSLFAPLIYKSVLYLVYKNQNDNNFIAGNEPDISLKGEAAAQLRVVRPGNIEEFIRIDDQEGTEYITYESTDLAGFYKFYSGAELIQNFAVNADPSESIINYSDESDVAGYFKQIGFKGILINVEKEEDPLKIILQARFGSELWKYFLLFAVITALVEMFVARNTRKELSEVS